MNEQVNYAKIQRIQDDLEALTIGQFGTGFVTDAMLYESGIKNTVANHTSQLADNASTIGGDSKQIWYPPLQPASNDIAPISNTKLSDFSVLWEGLRTAFPNYITRELLGKDQTDTYDIYKYIFQPKNYEKTIIISSNIHGSETEGQRILYRFLYHICYDYNKYTQLSYVRNKVRLIIIPCPNPAGLLNMTRGNGNRAVNTNGVDLNRNFTYGWNQFVSGDITYKGASSLSEKESQYIDQTLSLYSSQGATAYIDIHNTGDIVSPAVNTAHYYAPVSAFGETSRHFVNQVINAVAPYGFTINRNVQKNFEPTSFNQAAMYYNMHSVSVEWEPGAVYGKPYRSAEDVTEGLKFIGNIILQLISKTSPKMDNIKEPFSVELGHANTSITTTQNNTWENIQGLQYTFSPKTEGLLLVDCIITFQNTNVAAVNSFTLVAEQVGNTAITTSTVGIQATRNEIYVESNGKRDTVTLKRVIPIYGKDDLSGDVTVKPQWKCDVGTIANRRARMYITFIPSDIGNRYKAFYNDSNQNMVEVYPGTIA